MVILFVRVQRIYYLVWPRETQAWSLLKRKGKRGGTHNPPSTKGLRLRVVKVSPARKFFEIYAISQTHQKVNNMNKYIKGGELTC